MKAKEYTPGGEYTYIADLESYQTTYSPLQEEALESHGRDSSYPAEYCNNVVFGGYEIEVDATLHLQGALVSDKKYKASEVNLAKPLSGAYNQADQLFNNMEFGQEAGEDVPAKLEIYYPPAGGTQFKWYKNGTVVATESLTNTALSKIALAVRYSGSTILSYAYVYIFNDAFWTSGVKNDSNVLAILNTGGDMGSDESKYGFGDEELGDFVLSLIFGASGQDTYTGSATDTITGSGRPGQALTNLEGKCEQYGGYLGTDLIEYMSNGRGWNYLKTQADADTPVEVKIPTAVENKFVTISCKNRNGIGPYFYMIDPDGNESYVPTSVYERGQGKVFLTWYPQSAGFNSSSRIIMCYYTDNGSQAWYSFTGFDLQGEGALFDEYNPEDETLKDIAGYDPEGGQEDEPQDDPADVEDPEYDPLASGFLYAFMVGATDMENLADCLIADTLAEKIRGDFGNNLFEFIVSYHMMPCLTNADSLNKVNILYRGQPFVYGENDTQLALAPISQTWYTVSCGSRVCRPTDTRKNGFENWAQAQVQLYLPFIGYVHLNTADVWGKTITISYKFDILQGTCVANIGVGSNGTIYSFEGTCKYTIPFTSTIDQSISNIMSGISSSVSVVGALGGVASSGSPAGLVNAVGGVGDAAGHFLSAFEHKSIINRSGSLTGSPGWLMPRNPALIITVPDIIDQTYTFYNQLNGYPCCVSDYLVNYQGYYVEVGQIDLTAEINANGSLPNDTELDMIKSQLKEGVYV